jgi:spermidine/putrescine transport system permease protein
MSDLLAQWSPWMRRVVTVIGIALIAFLYLPILVLLVYSFSASHSLTFPITSYTFGWYEKLAGNEDLLRSVRNSFIVAGGTVPLTLLIGVPAAYGLTRFAGRFKGGIEQLLTLPLMIPGIVTGLSILLLVKRAGFGLSLGTVIIGHTVAWLPIVVTQVAARLQRFDVRIEHASLDLGAGHFRTFWLVTLPNIKNAIIGSAMLVFTLSFDEIAITFLLTGTENTLPMHIWAMLRHGVSPEVCAIASIMVAVSICLALIGYRQASDRG